MNIICIGNGGVNYTPTLICVEFFIEQVSASNLMKEKQSVSPMHISLSSILTTDRHIFPSTLANVSVHICVQFVYVLANPSLSIHHPDDNHYYLSNLPFLKMM